MIKGIIKLCLTKVIDVNASGTWDRHVFEDSYKEFFMQAQQFDQQKRYTTFQDIVKNVPKADAMHYLVSTSIVGYLHLLNEKFPEVLNTAGKTCVPFKNFKFEVLQSSTIDKSLHKVSIQFYSTPLIWVDTFDKHLIFAPATQCERFENGEEIDTETISLQPNLGIFSFRKYA